MKKTILFTILMTIAVSSFSQKFGIKLNTGTMISEKIYPEKIMFSISPEFMVKFSINDYIQINPILGYNYFRSPKFAFTDNDGNLEEINFSLHSIIFDLPIQFNLKFSDKSEQYFYLLAGYKGQYFLKATPKYDKFQIDYDMKFTLSNGFISGIGLNINKHFFTEINYSKTFNNKSNYKFGNANIAFGYIF